MTKEDIEKIVETNYRVSGMMRRLRPYIEFFYMTNPNNRKDQTIHLSMTSVLKSKLRI